ncbi:MAG: ribosome silencing factor [Actinobacteria bacterium]|nr:ribosome silencing factor [Actinomycetota bacterium]
MRGAWHLLNPDEFAIEAARAADDKKAADIRIMDMRDALGVTDYFVIASGKTDRQVKRIQSSVEERLGKLGLKPSHREGEKFGRWILLDYTFIIVHLFLEDDRTFYDLERIWKDVPFIEWRESEQQRT